MKRCPRCGEILLDSTVICPVCGYEFESLDSKKSKYSSGRGEVVSLRNGGAVKYIEEVFVDKYPPFLEGVMPAVVLEINNDSSQSITLIISAEIEKYTFEDKKTISLDGKGYYQYVYYPSFKREYMDELKSYGKSVLRYTIEGDVKYKVEKKENITILSYGDILWKIDDVSLAQYIVKWVTPRENVIRNHLLNMVMDEMENLENFKEMMKKYGQGNKGMIVGMQLGKDGIYAQMWALFNALKKWGIRYKSTPVSILRGYQRVRLPKEVLSEKGGNCIDLTVTFASALEAMDLIPVIFLTLSHAFPGVMIPRNFVEEKKYFTRSSDIFEKINRKYENMVRRAAENSEGRSTFTDMDEYLYRCCGEYVLPVEATMIPDANFTDAVSDIKIQDKMSDVEEIVVVPIAREQLGEDVLPYEDIRVSSKFSGRWRK